MGGGYPQMPLSFFEQKDFPLGGKGGYTLNGKNPLSSIWRVPYDLKSLPFLRLEWRDPGVWRCQLSKTCWNFRICCCQLIKDVSDNAVDSLKRPSKPLATSNRCQQLFFFLRWPFFSSSDSFVLNFLYLPMFQWTSKNAYLCICVLFFTKPLQIFRLQIRSLYHSSIRTSHSPTNSPSPTTRATQTPRKSKWGVDNSILFWFSEP